MSDLDRIHTVAELRSRYGEVGERVRRAKIRQLDGHCRAFIGLSPFFVLATASADGQLDASPRGGAPGFVKVQDDRTLLIPDAPGNNRLDSLENLLALPEVGLLFVIPGFDETLRVNGSAALSVAPADLAAAADERRAPKVVVRVAVREAFLHCAKAFMRAKLWDAASAVPRATLPTMGQMVAAHTGLAAPDETPEQMRKRYEPDL